MDSKLLGIYLQAQAIISEREGMVAENKQREHLNQSMAYTEESFYRNARAFEDLIEWLSK